MRIVSRGFKGPTRLVGAQATLWPDSRHHGLVSDRAGTAGAVVELDQDHRRHAVVELAIRDLKQGAGLCHCPSGVFSVMTPAGYRRMTGAMRYGSRRGGGRWLSLVSSW
jgi:hypothetical protein